MIKINMLSIYSMPNKNGYEATHRQLAGGIIAITAGIMSGDKEKC
jgi:hypothetical protein